MVSDTSNVLHDPKMIFWKLPKIVDFWWKFHSIRFFIFLFLEAKKLAILGCQIRGPYGTALPGAGWALL